MLPTQSGAQFFGPPAGVLSAQRLDAINPQLTQGMGPSARRARLFLQGGYAAVLITT
jgi:hypothetical protein